MKCRRACDSQALRVRTASPRPPLEGGRSAGRVRARWNACGLVIAAMSVVATAWADPESPQLLSHVVARLNQLHRVTDQPHAMEDSTAALCVLTFNPNIHEGSGDPAFCHVYVNVDAKEPMESGTAYPHGAVIVKEKFASEAAEEAILYTVMRKMAAGYDPDHGDWEYAVLDGKNKRVLARGRIESCIECHRTYASTDFVTRAYLNDN